MTTPEEHAPGLTRRHLIAGAGAAAAGAALIGTTFPGSAGASAPPPAPADEGVSALALDPLVQGLTYINIDMLAFRTAQPNGWASDDTGGTTSLAPGYAPLTTPLPLPAGSVIRQVNIAYQGTPRLAVVERSLTTPKTPQKFVNITLSGGAMEQTQSLAADVTIKPAHTYSLQLENMAAGYSVYGVTIGYKPQSYAPYTGSTPRVLDTRLAGGRFAAGETRSIDFSGHQAQGSAAVFNLTADQPSGIGYLSAFSYDLPDWPGNSSLNFSPAIPKIANGVITTLGAGNRIKIRAGEHSTHVIVDVIGYLL